ncbi:MAG: zinc-ribbon domain-containing protein, partial [Gemmataceae bacterium]|nr:zinc-ribbon domain-containing protein [Gemmataceae bacterium]
MRVFVSPRSLAVPLASCPKCATGLRVPDGAGAVRCPKCQTVFQPPKSPPAFEVVDEAPPKPA